VRTTGRLCATATLSAATLSATTLSAVTLSAGGACATPPGSTTPSSLAAMRVPRTLDSAPRSVGSIAT
jgi:hypothetical protein